MQSLEGSHDRRVRRRIGPEAVQQAAILALGHCRQECVSMLLEEMQSLGEDSIDRAKVGHLQLLSKNARASCRFTNPILGKGAVS